MTKDKEKTEQELFDSKVDYEVPSIDRIKKYELEDGHIIYLNNAQFNFLLKFYWEEKRRRYLESRCLIISKYNGLKRCDQKCSNCLHFKNNENVVSLDYLFDTYKYDIPDNCEDIIEVINRQEKISRVHQAIEEISDEINRKIIELCMQDKNDIEISKELKMPRRTINDRKKKIFSELAKKLKDYKNY